MSTETNSDAEDALTNFANGLSDLINKHKRQTVSLKAARSWQFRAKKSVNQSWAKVLKKKSSSAHFDDMKEEGEGQNSCGEEAKERRKQRRASLLAEEKAHADGIRASIIREVEKYDKDKTTNFDELFEKEVVYAVDELRTRQDDKDKHQETSSDEEEKQEKQKRRGKKSNGKRHSLSFKSDHMEKIKEKESDATELIHGVFWHIHSALERRRARPLETFRTFDKDDSGSITHEEFLEGCGTMGYTISKTESLLIFETLDADGSGELDYRELVQHIKRAGRRGPPKHDGHKKRVQRDNDKTEQDGSAWNQKKIGMPKLRELHPGRNKPSLYQKMLRSDAVALQGGPNGKHLQQNSDPTIDVLGYGLRIPPAPDSTVYCRRSDVLVCRGLALCEAGAFTEAEVQFEQALNADINHVQAHMQLASLLWNTNRPDLALSHFKTCVNLRPRWPDPLFNCGVVQFRLGRNHQAKNSFQNAIELQSKLQRYRKNIKVLPGDDVGTQAAHNLLLVERRLSRFRADSALDLRTMKQRQRSRKLRESLNAWFERGRGKKIIREVEEAKSRLKKAGYWPIPPMFEYSTITARNYIRGEEPNWDEMDKEKKYEEDFEMFGKDADSSEEEEEENRRLARKQEKYFQSVLHSLISGNEEWADFPISIFKLESRGSDSLKKNPHLSWAITKKRLLQGDDSSSRNGVGSVSASADARVVPINDHERMERQALRKALVTAPENRSLHQIELLVHASSGFPYLSRFHNHDLRAIWKYLRFSTRVSGDELLKEGDIPHELIIVLDGRCWLRKKVDHKCGKSRNMTIGKADEGEAVGEDELRRKLQMRTQVVAAQDLELLILTRSEYESTVQIVNQRDSGAKETFIVQSRVLEGFNDDGKEIKRLALLAQKRHYKSGQVIATIGSPAAEMLLVARGLVHAIRPVHYAQKKIPKDAVGNKKSRSGDEYDVIMATLTGGKCMGASVVLDPFNPRYKCTYKCATPVEVLVLGKEAFELRKITPSVMLSLERASVRSLSIEACTRVIDDKRKDAINKTAVLRGLKFIPPKRSPQVIMKEWMKKRETVNS